MAIETEGSKTYANINDLPLISNITDGDEFLVQTPTGTSRLDFSNFIITLDNCSFKSRFNDMWETYSSNSDLIDKIGTEAIVVDNLDVNNLSLSGAVTQLNVNINTLKDSHKAKINEIVSKVNEIITVINAAHSTEIVKLDPLA